MWRCLLAVMRSSLNANVRGARLYSTRKFAKCDEKVARRLYYRTMHSRSNVIFATPRLAPFLVAKRCVPVSKRVVDGGVDQKTRRRFNASFIHVLELKR